MDKNICQQIDDEMLVEQYVAGRLKGELLDKFEEHIQTCPNHAHAVTLEKALKRGVSEFARGELKSKIRERLQKREDTRFLLLRYAAILFVAVITPLLLYYQLNVYNSGLEESLSVTKETALKDSSEGQSEGEKQFRKTAEEESVIPPTDGNESRHEPDPIKTAQEIEKAEIPGRDTETKIQAPPPLEESAIPPPPVPDAKSDMEKEGEVLEDLAARNRVKTSEGASKRTPPMPMSQAAYHKAPVSSLSIQLDDKIKQDKLALKYCIESNLEGAELQEYQINLRLHISDDGGIDEIVVINSSKRSDELEDCLTILIKKWHFEVLAEEKEIETEFVYKDL
jgi:hypothetical protein